MARNLRMNIGVLVFLVTTLISCDSNRIYEEHIAIPKGIWSSGNRALFNVTISDLTARYNVYMNVRNGPEYAYSNLFLFLNTTTPDGKTARDTVELTLADFDGRWLGSGMGSVKFSRFLFRKGVKFQQQGAYRFSLEQAMRVPDLTGIYDIGLRIERE